MNMDIQKLSEIDLGFPGIEIGSEQSAIDAFVENIPEYVSFASEQYALRARRAIEMASDRYEPGEYFQRLDDIEDRAKQELPQFYYRQASVMLWTHFEWSLKRLLSYAISQDSNLPPFGSKEHRLSADTFCKKMRRYYERQFNEPNILESAAWQALEKPGATRVRSFNNTTIC